MIDASDEFAAAGLNVSRETIGRLEVFAGLLAKWNTAINLVAKTTLAQVWFRHILDSAQAFQYGREAGKWADLGSGGGFPGLVVAILAAEKAPAMQITLVEADQRKSAFLRQVCQTLGLRADVLSERIESIPPLRSNVVSARALAPLSQLCAFASNHLAADGTAIFLKGRSFDEEVVLARQEWNFSLESHVSMTDPSSVVLLLRGIVHV